jgi:hypothetical protein
MTPTEMCVLFSGNVLAFLLIRLTGFVIKEPAGQAPASQIREKASHLGLAVSSSEPKGVVWNVASFLGLKA